MATTMATTGWNKNTRTGWKKEGGKWVQYKKGVRTGQTRRHKLETNALGSAIVDTWRGATSKSGLRSATVGDNRRALEISRAKIQEAKKAQKKDQNKSSTTKSTKKPNVKSVGTVDFNVNTESGKAAYNKALKASKTSGAKTDKEKDKSTTEALHGKSNERAKWLHKTRNSPAAKSGVFTDDERWAQQQKHRKWKADRKASRENKKVSKGPAPKLDEKQKTQLKTENKVKLKVDQLPKDKVKLKDGSIVDRSSLYKKNK